VASRYLSTASATPINREKFNGEFNKSPTWRTWRVVLGGVILLLVITPTSDGIGDVGPGYLFESPGSNGNVGGGGGGVICRSWLRVAQCLVSLVVISAG
jgi:hypothetical protein